VRDRLSLVPARRKNDPVIYFITPTSFRPAQRADLTRLSYALSHIPNLYWIVVEDSDTTSESVAEVLKRSRLPYTHINVKTPEEKKMKYSDPSWYLPRGVAQRNAALAWISYNLSDVFSFALLISVKFYRESHFLTGLGLTRSDLEPKAALCSKVYVWHTRTEKGKFSKEDWKRIAAKDRELFDDIEAHALGL
ncbi:glycosyltransferase family 43, partial [Teladorsagia circumcincta]